MPVQLADLSAESLAADSKLWIYALLGFDQLRYAHCRKQWLTQALELTEDIEVHQRLKKVFYYYFR
jgi:hypothetical protein